jgi:transcriptional regulator with XRE-family HTH domain
MSIPFTFVAWHSDTVTNLGSVQHRRDATVSPYASRIRLGAAIRELRGDLTTAEVARRAGLDRSVVSKIEAAERRAGLDTILRILDVLPIEQHGPEYRALQQVARAGLGQGWWHGPEFRRMGDRQARVADLECGTTAICEYQPGMIPGLLQTEAYATERAHVALGKGEQLDLAATVAGRIRRQQQIIGPSPAEYVAVLERQAVERPHVSAAVMRDQLRHLHRLAVEAANVHIHVLPIDARLPSGWVARETFAVYEYSADQRVVLVDSVHEDRVLTSPRVMAEYAQILKELRHAALSEEDSAVLIQRAAEVSAADA